MKILKLTLAAALALTILTPAFAQIPVDPGLVARAQGGPVRVLVQMKVATQPIGTLSGAAVVDQQSAIATAQAQLRGVLGGADVITYRAIPWLAAQVSAAQLAALAAHPLVASIHIDSVLRPALQQSVASIGAPAVWQNGYDGTGWAIAVLDTGSDSAHPFLVGKTAAEACFSTTSGESTSLCPGGVSVSTAALSAMPCTASGCDHGTHVAGIAVGRAELPEASGVARGSRLIPVQVFSQFADAGACAPTTAPCALAFISDIARALDHLVALTGTANSARIAAVNLSVEGPAFTTTCDNENGMPAIKSAVDQLLSIGIATIVAAGNGGRADAVSEPACISTVVSVGSTLDTAATLAPSSNRAAFLSLLAPGDSIRSAVPGGGYATLSGTSMAAPHVAGAWAVLRQLQPTASVASLYTALRNTGTAVVDPQTGLTYRRIRVDSAAATLASAGVPGSPVALRAAVSAPLVVVEWGAPPIGGAPTNYVLQAGSAPGLSDIAIFSNGTATRFAVNAPTGLYYVRVLAQNAGGSGLPTADIEVPVGGVTLPPAPLAPVNVRATVVDGQVTLAWDIAPGSAAAVSSLIDVGRSAGQSDVGSFDINSAATSVSSSMLGPGTYFVRVRSRNATGLSAASDDVTFTVPDDVPCSLPPGAPTGLVSTVAGNSVTLAWARPVSSVVTSYIVEAGSGPGDIDALVFDTGSQSATFGATAPAGSYWVRVRAVNACGTGVASSEIVVVVAVQ